MKKVLHRPRGYCHTYCPAAVLVFTTASLFVQVGCVTVTADTWSQYALDRNPHIKDPYYRRVNGPMHQADFVYQVFRTYGPFSYVYHVVDTSSSSQLRTALTTLLFHGTSHKTPIVVLTAHPDDSGLALADSVAQLQAGPSPWVHIAWAALALAPTPSLLTSLTPSPAPIPRPQGVHRIAGAQPCGGHMGPTLQTPAKGSVP